MCHGKNADVTVRALGMHFCTPWEHCTAQSHGEHTHYRENAYCRYLLFSKFNAVIYDNLFFYFTFLSCCVEKQKQNYIDKIKYDRQTVFHQLENVMVMTVPLGILLLSSTS